MFFIPQYRQAAPSSSVGYWRAHPSPPGTDPPALENTRWEGKEKGSAHITGLQTQWRIQERGKSDICFIFQSQQTHRQHAVE